MSITGEQVKKAVLAAGLKYIPHHDCGICHTPVGYYVQGDDLVFDGSCDCSSGGSYRIQQWGEAAAWINMQSKEENRTMLMKRFALT